MEIRYINLQIVYMIPLFFKAVVLDRMYDLTSPFIENYPVSKN